MSASVDFSEAGEILIAKVDGSFEPKSDEVLDRTIAAKSNGSALMNRIARPVSGSEHFSFVAGQMESSYWQRISLINNFLYRTAPSLHGVLRRAPAPITFGANNHGEELPEDGLAHPSAL